MYGTIRHLLEDPTLEIWLIVRTQVTTSQLQAGTPSPFDDSYPSAKALQAALGNDHIIYICSNNVDDQLVTVGMQHHWNVMLHLHGFNDGHFWRSLVMAKLAEIYIDAVGMASLLLTDMGRSVGVASWTFTGHELVSKVQLAIQDREAILYTPCIYQTELWYQELVLSWGDPPTSLGPPGLLYGGECTRITETGGAEFLQAVIDIMHQASANHGVNVTLHIQGPTSKISQIIEFAIAYCKENNYDEELCKRIVQFPFFRDKEKYIQHRFRHPCLLPVSGDPIGPHTGCVDGAITWMGTLFWSKLGEWQSKVPKAINNALGLGQLLNTTTRDGFVRTGVECMTNPKMMLAMRTHTWNEMKLGRGFYNSSRLANALSKTVPHCLNLARMGLPADGRLPDVDTSEYFSWEPSPEFVFPAIVVFPVDDSITMKVNEVLQVFTEKGVTFVGPWRAGAEVLLAKVMEVMTFDPSTVRRGGARITFQGYVKQPRKEALIGWHEHRRGLAKIEYPRLGPERIRVIGPSDVHNSENIREGQNSIAIQPILGKTGRMQHTVPSLLPLLDDGRASLGFVKVDLSPKSSQSQSGSRLSSAPAGSAGFLICLFCEVVPEGTDMYGSKTFKAVQDLWRDHGEISESARAFARNVVHTGAWLRQQTGATQMDISWGNLFPIPWKCSAPWLDQAIRDRMPEPANVGWCDLGGCINVGTMSERKDNRPGSSCVVPPLMRNATQADPSAKRNKNRPRFPKADAASGFGVLSNSHLAQFAEHRRKNAAGIGRPTGGTPECTHKGMKQRFDSAGDDERVAVEAAVSWQSFGEGVIIFSQFVPRQSSHSTAEYITMRDKAAVSPEAVLKCMT